MASEFMNFEMARHFVEDLGLCVIPVPFKSKRPTLEWKPYQERLPTSEELQQWFNGHQTNAAIICGRVSGLVAVDTDSVEAETWAQEHLPPTPWMAKTARGIHRFYGYPDGDVKIGNKAHVGKLSLDLRGDGGYVIAPGSVHPSGVLYHIIGEWRGDVELPVFDLAWFPAAPTPAWGDGTRLAPIQRMTETPSTERLSVMERARRWLAKKPPAVSGAGGNTFTYSAAGKLVNGYALSDQEALEVLIEWNDTCDPPWTHEDLSTFIGNARKYGKEPKGQMLKWLSGPELYRTPVSGFHRVGEVEYHETHLGPMIRVEYQDVHVIRETGEESVGARRTIWYEEVGPDVWGPTSAPGPPLEGPEAWPEPVPLHLVPGAQFPVDALPGWVREYVICLAESLQVPLEATCMMALPILALCCAKKYVIQMKSDWIEPANLWVVIAMPVAQRKTAVLGKMMAPIHDWERAEAKRIAPLIKEANNRKRILEGKLEKANQAAISAKPGSDQDHANENAKQASMDLERHVATIPKTPRLTASDATPEKIVALMAENQERIAIVSDEGEIFQIVAGRYSDGKSGGGGNLKIESLLKAHSGAPIRTDRMSRDSELLHSPALSMALLVQPVVIQALSKAMRGKGFLARFLYSLPASEVGDRQSRSAPVSHGTYRIWKDYLFAILDLPWNVGEDMVERVPWVLQCTAEAQERLRQFEDEIEPQLRPDGELGSIADWAGKLAGAVGRVATNLHVADRVVDDVAPHEALVSIQVVERAIRIAKHLVVQARLAYSEIGTGEESPEADLVLSWLRKAKPAVITCRDVWMYNRGCFQKPSQCVPALERLTDHGWIRKRPEAFGGKGGRPGLPVYDVWPGILG